MENLLGSSLNQIQGLTTVRESYSRALEHEPLVVAGVSVAAAFELKTTRKAAMAAKLDILPTFNRRADLKSDVAALGIATEIKKRQHQHHQMLKERRRTLSTN